MSHSSVHIQISPESAPTTPCWFAEVAIVAQVLKTYALVDLIQTKVQFARARFGKSRFDCFCGCAQPPAERMHTTCCLLSSNNYRRLMSHHDMNDEEHVLVGTEGEGTINMQDPGIETFDGRMGHDDPDYVVWLQQHTDGFVANVSRIHSKIILHQAACPQIHPPQPGESLTRGAHFKVCSAVQDVEILVQYLMQTYPKKRKPKYCQSPRRNGCGTYWTPDGHRR
jgi:hypothetical protein